MAVKDVIGRNVNRFRRDRGYSLGALAKASGLAKQTIASIEAGRGNPTVQTLEELAGALQTTIRALMAEMGTEILTDSGAAVRWHEQGAMHVRSLDHSFGSGYVYNAVLRLEANRGVAHQRAAGSGTLRHCYVLEGRVRLGPDSSPVIVQENDFVRFPGDARHIFEALTPVAYVHVCTTAPQQSMSEANRPF